MFVHIFILYFLFYPGYFEKVEGFFQVACAIINAFSPPLCKNTAEKCKIADRALALVDKYNLMEYRVEEERLNRHTNSWKLASSSSFLDFPILTVEELQIITLGIYQINLSKRYVYLHMKYTRDFEIKLNEEFPGVARAKIESRFAGNKAHDLWIEFDNDKTGVDTIAFANKERELWGVVVTFVQYVLHNIII
jgi:hypothetical protein